VQSSWFRSRWTNGLIGVSFTLLAIGHYLVVPWYARFHSPMLHAAEVEQLCRDSQTPVVCYPRNCDSVAFYLGRDDLRSYRSKEIEDLRHLVRTRPRTVILCTHRHSLLGLRQLLPPEVGVVEAVHFGLRDIPGVPGALMK